jgi:hypothetical protein
VQSVSSQQHDRTVESDLCAALTQSGCPVCRVSRESAHRMTWDAGEAGGLCMEHLALVIERSDVFAGVTIALAAMERVADDVTVALPCHVCGELAEATTRTLVALGHGVAVGDLGDRFARSDGLCLMHLRPAIAHDAPGIDALLQDRRMRIERLREKLGALLASFEPAGGRAGDGTWLEAEHALRRAPAQLALPSGPLT